MKNLVIAYHAYMFGDHYIDMMTEQFRLLIHSGLYNACNKLYIGIATDPNMQPKHGVEWAKRFYNFTTSGNTKSENKVEIVIYQNNNELRPTLWWIRDYARDHPGEYIMFFHTKGITHNDQPNTDWRRYMEYFVIEQWQDCVQKLDEGFDCCGVLWNCDAAGKFHPHFSGAFYWAKTDFINTLDYNYLTSSNRYDGEFWIGTNKKAKVYEFHNSHMNDAVALFTAKSHYSLPYPRSQYVYGLSKLNQEDGQFLSDKGVIHKYLEKYDELFKPYRDREINIFEVGFQYGGSCRLWEKYFPKATIRAIDIQPFPTSEDELIAGKFYNMKMDVKTGPRVIKEIKDSNKLTRKYFADFAPDIAIDDGSHKPKDQLRFVKTVYPVLRKGGLLIVEDIPDLENQIEDFKKLGWMFSIVDWRSETGVTDDVILIFRK